jgi:hypothetical protein
MRNKISMRDSILEVYLSSQGFRVSRHWGICKIHTLKQTQRIYIRDYGAIGDLFLGAEI